MDAEAGHVKDFVCAIYISKFLWGIIHVEEYRSLKVKMLKPRCRFSQIQC